MFSYITSVCSRVTKIVFILAFLPALWKFSLVSLYLFEEDCTSLELPFHFEDNGIGPISLN